MKNKIISALGGAACLAGLAASPAVLGSDSADVSKALAGATALELPAKASEIVAKTPPAAKQEAAAAVVKAAVGVNPAAAAAIVAAVSREDPAGAALAAVAAATLQRKEIGPIARAAAAAAPAEAARIVAALIKEFPQDYGTIAIAADEGAPQAGREILAVVAEFVPALQPSIRGAMANFAGDNSNVPVQAILTQSYNQALTSGAVATQSRPDGVSAYQRYNQAAVSDAGASDRAVTPAQIATGPAPIRTAGAAMPASSPRPMLAPVLGNPFVPILGPGFGGTPPVTISINYASPEPTGGRTGPN
jgi:hypothetical protein